MNSATQFKKGHSGYWLGKTRPTFSVETRQKMSIGHLGKKKEEESHLWKGDKVSYDGAHAWLRGNFGKPSKCENREMRIFRFRCSKKSQKFDWAFISNKGFARDRTLYRELCRSCHFKYDKRNYGK